MNQKKRFSFPSCAQMIDIPMSLQERVRFEVDNNSSLSTIKIPLVVGEDFNERFIDIFTMDYYNIEYSYVGNDRFRYIADGGFNKNIVYATINPSRSLMLKSAANVERNILKVSMKAIFVNPGEAFEFTINKPIGVAFEETEYPIDERMVPLIIELILKEDLIPTASISNKKAK